MRSLRPLGIAAIVAAVGLSATLTAVPVSAAPSTQVVFTKGENGYGCHRIPAILRAGNGDLLAFAEARTDYCGDAGHIDLVMKRSTDDDGQTWSAAKSLGDVIDEPDWGWCATGPGGGIQLTRGERAGAATETRAFAVSADAGDGFENPFKTIPDLVGTPKVQGSILRLRATDAGDSYDRVLFASPVHSKLRMTMTIRSSFDEGKTWQSVDDGTVVDADRAGYSNMAVLGNGDIGLFYEAGAYPDGDARDDIRFARFEEGDLDVP